MYEAVIAVGGLFLGYLIARMTKEELAAGEKWLRLICNAILGVFVLWILINAFDFKLGIGIVIGLILGFFIFNPYLYLGLLGVMTYYGLNRELFAILVMLFGLSYMGLYYKQAGWKFFVFYICLFLLPYALVYFENNYNWLWYGIAIGGMFHVVRENYPCC